MNTFFRCLLTIALLAAATLTFAEDKASPEAAAYEKFKAGLEPKDPPTRETPREEVMKWQKNFLTGIADSADVFLKAYPASDKNAEVKVIKAEAFLRMAEMEQSDEYGEKSRAIYQEVAKSKPADEKLAFQVHARLMALADNTKDAIAEGELLLRDYPKNPALPVVMYRLAIIYDQAGEAENAKKTAQTIIDKYPDSEEAEPAQIFMKKLELIGKPMELKVKTLDGKELDIKNLRGKVVLVDFWATWCMPCVAELPHVQKTYTEFHDKGFEVVGISLDRSREKLEKFIADKKLPWPQYLDEKGEIALRFGVMAIPSTFLVDKEGKIVRSDLRGEALSKAVAELLGKK